jgi:aminoglycoside phosphotransferase (APT) family kinase protein
MGVVTGESELLSGGHWTEVLRVGDTVHRARRSTSGFSERLLRFLGERGYPFAPRFHGHDDAGRQVLDFVPGATTDHPSQRDEAAYVIAASQLRSLHDLTAGSPLAADEECVIHGDSGPYNAIFRDGIPVAFIDWDAARPGRRLDDLGYLAWTWCVIGVPGIAVEDQARRLAEVRDGYGLDARVDLLSEVVRVQETHRDTWARWAEQSIGPSAERYRRAVAWAERDLAVVREHEDAFRAALEADPRRRA